MTRENDPAAGERYAGRLGKDPGLTLHQVLRAITANAAYELHAQDTVGTLQTGKFAEFIVPDRNIFSAPPEQLASVKMLLTVVGGKPVYAAAPFAAAGHQAATAG